ncbi:hypothetical protein [Cohnella sp. JJ-181]|uniref:hypothetical protein n=1 Tax=Cohnella rhizoplanae TaxID=2974897 RepID=UPI0022FF8988|nr:hypothetical protein [Cohnella sp. JJ-181]CAI6083604.1 hypothetical protein COHCIP112018_04056 [Cohnella sp. JJ-181]
MPRYSNKPLAERLGLKPFQRLYFEDAPLLYLDALGPSPAGIRFLEKPDGPIDFIHLFVRERHTLEARLPLLAKQLSPRGMLWVSWPGRQSDVTGMDGDAVREIGAAWGLSGVKTCEIDDRWIGCKLVYRKRGRPRAAGFASATLAPPNGRAERREAVLATAMR